MGPKKGPNRASRRCCSILMCPRMVTCELSRVWCWLRRSQHNREHMHRILTSEGGGGAAAKGATFLHSGGGGGGSDMPQGTIPKAFQGFTTIAL